MPLIAQAAPQGYQGMVHAVVKYSNVDGTNPHTLKEGNAAKTSNMYLTFDNMSGIVSRGQMSFDGMWIGFGGTALTPAPTMFQGSLQCGGAISPDGAVSYNMATNTYTGTGDVIEFVGTMLFGGAMKVGWTGQYGTPDAGPGNDWMPGWGQGGSLMPGWGGSVSNWGMMGAYGQVSPTPNGGYMAPGGGMMGGGGGMGQGAGTQGQAGAAAVSGRVGMMKTWVAPTTAAIIHVVDGTPDHSNPTPVLLSITLPAMSLNTMP